MWLVANPANAKKNGPAFLTRWLARDQERAPRVEAGAVPGVDDETDEAADAIWDRAAKAAQERAAAQGRLAV